MENIFNPTNQDTNNVAITNNGNKSPGSDSSDEDYENIKKDINPDTSLKNTPEENCTTHNNNTQLSKNKSSSNFYSKNNGNPFFTLFSTLTCHVFDNCFGKNKSPYNEIK